MSRHRAAAQWQTAGAQASVRQACAREIRTHAFAFTMRRPTWRALVWPRTNTHTEPSVVGALELTSLAPDRGAPLRLHPKGFGYDNGW